MATESERTRVMKQNFMALHKAGLTIPEIGEKHNLTKATVYRHLDEIAKEHNVTRESLLQQLHTPTERQINDENDYIKVTAEELEKGFNEANDAIDNLVTLIDKIIGEEEKCL